MGNTRTSFNDVEGYRSARNEYMKVDFVNNTRSFRINKSYFLNAYTSFTSIKALLDTCVYVEGREISI